MISLTIPEVPRGPNGHAGLLRMHWRVRNQYRDRWYWLIRAALPVMVLEPQTERCKVRIHQVRKRRLDPDNLVASVKYVLDSLIRWGVIKDDSPGWIELTVTQEAGRPCRTLIEVER